MIAYVAGPMSGYPLYNFPAFDECQDHLQGLGYEVISPAGMDREVGFDPATSAADKYFLEAAMKRDVEAIMRVDFMVMLPGWRSSVGATAEYHLAKWRHISVYEWPEMLEAVDKPRVMVKTESAWLGEGEYPKAAPLPDGTLVGYVNTPKGRIRYCDPAFSKVEPKEPFTKIKSVTPEKADRKSKAFQYVFIGSEVLGNNPADPKAEEMARLDRLVVDNHRKCCPLPDLAAPDPKAKAASEKCPMHLLPPTALAQTAWVHGLGAAKYGDWNWRETGIKFDTYVGAIMRHLMAMHDGEWLDPESGRPHVAHIAASCNILMDADAHDKLTK